MKCADPILCYKGKNVTLYRHFSLASPIIKISAQTVFDCGKCLPCRKKKARELAMRCVLHASLSPKNMFLTLTYDEKKEGYHNNFQYEDIQKFKKSLRRHCEYHYNKRIQIFNVHEYGKNQKKHWHLVVFNHDFEDKDILFVKNGHHYFTSPTLTKQWQHGIHTITDVTEASAMYQAQYTQKDFQYGNLTNGHKAHSKHSGIGRDYFLKHYRQILRLGYVPFNGQKIPIPRYFYKLAHKHWSHFYEPSNFFDTDQRKKLYTKFKLDEANRDIADLFAQYDRQRKTKIIELASEWDKQLSPFSEQKTDFQKSAENQLYDLQKRTSVSNF